MMRIKIITIVLVMLSSPMVLSAQQKKKPVEPSKAAVVKPKPAPVVVKEPEAYSYLLVNSDLDVNITVNYGKTYRVSSSDEGKRVPLEAGDNLVKITPLDGGMDGYTETITIEKKGNRVYAVKLKAARLAEQQRKEEETRKAEAEQQRKEKETLRAKAEQQRKEEEIRRAEVARKNKEEKAEAARKAGCSALVTSTVRKKFMCYNLGAANTSADPFTPSWEINGGYWQWGKKEMAAAGPSGPGSITAREGALSSWNTRKARDGSWKDGVKTENDPCPLGYRVPTNEEWEGVLKYNFLSDVGTWENSATNYSSGKIIGDQLFLPAAGARSDISGRLFSRGSGGFYWCSTEYDSISARLLAFSDASAYTTIYRRALGHSVRCIAE